jgi:hypothetical protein
MNVRSLLLSTAVLISLPIGVSGAAQISAQGIGAAVGDQSVIDHVQYRFAGREYCWYDDGWRGPGFYWCGYRLRVGLGWGGPAGWHGWRAAGGFRDRERIGVEERGRVGRDRGAVVEERGRIGDRGRVGVEERGRIERRGDVGVRERSRIGVEERGRVGTEGRARVGAEGRARVGEQRGRTGVEGGTTGRGGASGNVGVRGGANAEGGANAGGSGMTSGGGRER